MKEMYGIAILILLAILLVREIACWYWKINERLEEEKKQTEILKEILEEIRKSTP